MHREIRSAAPDVPWQAIYGLRNIVVHGYWHIDLEIIADVIENRLEPLISELDRLIAFVERVEK